MLLPLLFVGFQAAAPAVRVTPGPPQPTQWVSFSADLRIDHETRPTAFGRFVQDEHGCSRRETVHPDGSLMVVIQNFENETFYQLIRGNWTSRPMRLVPGVPRRAPVRPLTRKLPPIEGHEGEQFYIVARAVEGQKDMLRVRVMRHAERRGPGRVTGDVVEELTFPFTESVTTTKLAENFSIALVRIGRQQIR